MTPGVTTRLKVLAKLDIAERRKPQDGRIQLNAAAADRMLDVRVATCRRSRASRSSCVSSTSRRSRRRSRSTASFLVGAAVTGVLAQRLARKLCTHCCDVHAVRRRALEGARLARRRGRLGRDGLLPQARLPTLQPDGYKAGSASTSCSPCPSSSSRWPSRRPRARISSAPRSPRACEPSGTTAWQGRRRSHAIEELARVSI